MRSPIRLHLILLIVGLLASNVDASGPTIVVSMPQSVRSAPATGRVVVYLLHAELGKGERLPNPADGFIEEDPQPIFGVDVKDLKPDGSVTLDDNATSFPAPLSKLAPGKYRAQAVL